MWRILYFAQLAGQYGLFETLFHIQANCSRFGEHTSLKQTLRHEIKSEGAKIQTCER